MPVTQNSAREAIPHTGERRNAMDADFWKEEINEVLNCAREMPATRRADPDWQAASRFLVGHCRQRLCERG